MLFSGRFYFQDGIIKFIISVPVRSKFWGFFLHFLQFFIGNFALFSAKIVFFANISFSTSKQTTFVHVFCRKMTKKVNRTGTLIMNFTVISSRHSFFDQIIEVSTRRDSKLKTMCLVRLQKMQGFFSCAVFW